MKDRAGQRCDDGAGDYSQSNMKEIKTSRQDNPGGETDYKSEAEGDDLLGSAGLNRGRLRLAQGDIGG